MKTINKLFFCLYIIFAFTPLLSSMLYIQMGLMVAWGITILPLGRIKKKDWTLLIIIGSWLVYAITLRIIGFSSAAWGNYGIQVMFYFPLVVFMTYRSLLTEREQYHLICFVGIVMLINMLDNIYLLVRYPGANIELNFSDMYSNLNLGNSSFTFVMMLLLLVCFGYFLNRKRWYVIPVLAGVFYLVISSKTTAFLVFLIFAYLMVVEKAAAKLPIRYRAMIMILGVGILLFLYRFSLEIVSVFTNNEYILVRLKALVKGDTSSVYLARWGLAMLSISTFLEHPLFGIGYVKADFALVDYASTGIGHHSELIDHLGRYGMIGIVFYLLIFCNFYRYVKRLYGEKQDKVSVGMIYVAFMLYSVLNNSIDVAAGVVFFYVLPALADGQFQHLKKQHKGCYIVKTDRQEIINE